jgi:hypothetical protein
MFKTAKGRLFLPSIASLTILRQPTPIIPKQIPRHNQSNNRRPHNKGGKTKNNPSNQHRNNQYSHINDHKLPKPSFFKKQTTPSVIKFNIAIFMFNAATKKTFI